MLRRLTSLLTLSLFLLWILPLGVFIKPDQEKKACNGRRAICMCTHLLKKQMAKRAKSKKTFLVKGSGVPVGESGSPSLGQEFVHTVKVYGFLLAKNRYCSTAPDITETFFTRPIDHVPKA